jgi:hypothetical protein
MLKKEIINDLRLIVKHGTKEEREELKRIIQITLEELNKDIPHYIEYSDFEKLDKEETFKTYQDGVMEVI